MNAFDAIGKAFAQLPDPTFRRVLWRGLGVAFGIYIVLMIAGQFALEHWGSNAWWVQLLGSVAIFAVLTILFPIFATAGIGIFIDDVADAVERRHYPRLPPGRAPSAATATAQALKFLALSLTLNLLLSPLYLVGLFFPPLKLFVFYALNGYLLGREYFDQVAQRYVAPRDGRLLRRDFRWTRLTAGLAIAVLFSIPVLNLAVPLVATAAMVHVIRGRASRAGGSAVGEPTYVQSRQEG